MATATAPSDIELEGEASADSDFYYEIVGGQTVRRPHMGAESDGISVNLIGLIQAYAGGRLGRCFGGQCGYQGIFPHDPKGLRFPDVSFIRSGRLPGDKPPRGNMEIVPDLIAEVVSPNDKAENVEQRLTDFLRAGVPLAWMIYPLTKQVYVFHQGPAALRLGEGDVLDGEDVLPEFTCPLKDLFAGI